MVISRIALILALGRRDLAGSGRPAVLLVLPILAVSGRPVAVMSLRPCRMLVTLEDGPDRLLAGGVAGGDLQELLRGARLLAHPVCGLGSCSASR